MIKFNTLKGAFTETISFNIFNIGWNGNFLKSFTLIKSKFLNSFINNWDKITCGNLQKNQIRTQLVRSRFSKIEKDEQFNFLRSMRDVQDSIFLQCVSFDDIIDGKLHIEFSPKCFYCGRKEHVLAHKTFPIVVTCNENFFTSFLRTVLAVNANDELKIDPLHFDSNYFLMDSTWSECEKVQVNKCDVNIGEKCSTPSTDQFYSHKTDDLLHDFGGFFSSFYAYEITNMKTWYNRGEKKRKRDPPIPDVVKDFWSIISFSAGSGYI